MRVMPRVHNPASGSRHETSLLPTSIPPASLTSLPSIFHPLLTKVSSHVAINRQSGFQIGSVTKESREFVASHWNLTRLSKLSCIFTARHVICCCTWGRSGHCLASPDVCNIHSLLKEVQCDIITITMHNTLSIRDESKESLECFASQWTLPTSLQLSCILTAI
jgi:hypothetical protein